MVLNKIPRIKLYAGFAVILLVLVFFSGCTGNSTTQDPPPIVVTTHSAYKIMAMNGVNAKPGSVFLVVNMTIENHGGNDYTFNEKAVSITDGTPVEEKLYTRLTNNRYWGAIPPNEKRTGDVIFGVKENSQNYTLRFFYHKGQESFTQELGSIIADPGENAQAGSNTKPLNVTIHSALKTTTVKESTPRSGYVFIVINMTLENLADADYALNENTLLISGGGPLNQKMSGDLQNPMVWESIPSHEKRTGEVVFGVKEITPSFSLEFLDSTGRVVLKREIGAIPLSTYTSASSASPSSTIFPTEVFDSTNFSYVVENLDTPVKATQYAQKKFTFVYHDGCISYSPEKFFEGLKGDCKDYATFLTYVLARHDYDAKIVTFKYYDSAARNGHVVTLFTDKDGKMYYASTPDVTQFTEVTSVDDLLAKEATRLGVASIADHKVLDAGTLDVCMP